MGEVPGAGSVARMSAPALRIHGPVPARRGGGDLYVVDGRVTYERQLGAELVAEGWVVPGLVDAHNHLGLDDGGRSTTRRWSGRRSPTGTPARCCCATVAHPPTPAGCSSARTSRAWSRRAILNACWGVTGSGKTFTIANVIQQVQRPTLVIAHNKTLARSCTASSALSSAQRGGIFRLLLRLLPAGGRPCLRPHARRIPR